MPNLPRGAVLAVVTAATALVAAVSNPSEPPPLVPAQTDPTSAVRAPLVVAGIAGLRWEDVSAELTPTLWGLLEDGSSAGAVTIHTYARPACPEGGWLSLSAGRAVRGSALGSWCHPLPEVVPSGDGAAVSGWADLAETNLDTLYHPRIGTLGLALAESEVCATAVGPGAALALADPDGVVGRYLPEVSVDAFDCPLTVVDLGRTSVVDGVAGTRLRVDEALEALVDLVPAGTDLVVSSLSSPIAAPLALGVAVVTTDRSSTAPDGHLLTSPSTRWDGVVRLLDLPSTMTAALGVPEPALFNGSPIVLGADRPDVAATVEDLAALTSNDRVLRRVSSSFVTILSIAGLLLIAAAAQVLRRRRASDDVRPGRSALAVRTGLLIVAAAPVAAYLVALVPWWETSSPVLAMWISIVGIAVVLALSVQLGSGRSAPVWRPALLLSGLTVGVLLIDALLGTPLHRLSPMGPTAVTGGRYYGIGNSSFAVLGAHAVILCGALAAWALARGRRTAAVLVVAAVGTLTLVIDVGPTWGADLGGGPALLPAFVVLAVLVSGTTMTWRRALLTGAAALAVLAAIGLLDWLRPAAQRSHAGRFVQSVIDGDAWETVTRKATFAFATLTSGVVPLVTIVIFVILVLWVRQPGRFAPREVRTAFAAWPTLLPTCIALLVVLGLGALANDYGVRVVTIGLASALPLLAASTLAAAEQRAPSPVEPPQAGGKIPARGSIAGTS